mmetsp:Transcript_24983/g.71779  ORF Transcript_24983/g.71779 Transcript_24983/m.71779 type:complete len:286 (-) Transcript_24983:643-1500(-)
MSYSSAAVFGPRPRMRPRLALTVVPSPAVCVSSDAFSSAASAASTAALSHPSSPAAPPPPKMRRAAAAGRETTAEKREERPRRSVAASLSIVPPRCGSGAVRQTDSATPEAAAAPSAPKSSDSRSRPKGCGPSPKLRRLAASARAEGSPSREARERRWRSDEPLSDGEAAVAAIGKAGTRGVEASRRREACPEGDEGPSEPTALLAAIEAESSSQLALSNAASLAPSISSVRPRAERKGSRSARATCPGSGISSTTTNHCGSILKRTSERKRLLQGSVLSSAGGG